MQRSPISFPKAGWIRRILAVLAAGLIVGNPLLAQQPELKKLRVLLVIDTNSNLRASISIDQERMKRLLARAIPASRYDLTVLRGNNVTKHRILEHYQRLKTSEREALLFYYAGHGAIEPRTRDPYFYLQEGKVDPLFRSTLRKAMLAKHAGLTIVLSDCCSNLMRVPRTRKTPKPIGPVSALHPVIRSLFFQHRGLVDITASTNNSSWGDEQEGGIFTRSLEKTLLEKAPHLAGKGKGFISWNEYFPILQHETEHTFSHWARQQRAAGEAIDQKSQRPRAYRLPGGSGQGPAFAVVGVSNETDHVIAYRYRWSSESAWHTVSLPPGEHRAHSHPLGRRSGDLPKLEVAYGHSKGRHLAAKRVVGTPSYAAGKLYRFGRAKSTRGGIEAEDDSADEAEDSPQGERKPRKR